MHSEWWHSLMYSKPISRSNVAPAYQQGTSYTRACGCFCLSVCLFRFVTSPNQVPNQSKCVVLLYLIKIVSSVLNTDWCLSSCSPSFVFFAARFHRNDGVRGYYRHDVWTQEDWQRPNPQRREYCGCHVHGVCQVRIQRHAKQRHDALVGILDKSEGWQLEGGALT